MLHTNARIEGVKVCELDGVFEGEEVGLKVADGEVEGLLVKE